MTGKKLFKAALSIIAVIFVGIIISIPFIAKPVIEHVLARAGFEHAAVDTASIGFSGTHLKNITLGGDNKIGGVEAYASLSDILSRHVGQVVIADADIRLPLLPDDGQPSKGPVNLYAREIEFRDAVLTVVGPAGPLPVKLNGKLIDRGNDYQLKADFETTTDAITASGQVTATIDKQTRKIEAHVELADAKITLPNIDMKRANGWIEAVIVQGDELPVITAQLTAGATKIYSVPLQGLTLEASPAEIILNGQVMNNGGAISADIKTDVTDAALDKLSVTAEAKLNDLDALGLEKLNGQGHFTAALTAEKDKAAKWQNATEWKNLNGTVELTAQKLSLPGLVEGAVAAAKLTLALDPATKQLSIQAKDASYSDKQISLDKASADLTLHLGEHPVAEGKININEIAQKSDTAFIIPLRLSMQLQPMNSLQAGTGFSGEITEKNGLLYAKVQGKYNADTGAGDLSLNMPPLKLIKGVNELKSIFPATEQYIQEGNGTVGLSADIAWSKKAGKTVTTSAAELFLKDFPARCRETRFPT